MTSPRARPRVPPSWSMVACVTWPRATLPWCGKRCMSAPRCCTTRPTWRSRWPLSCRPTSCWTRRSTASASRCMTRWPARQAWAPPNSSRAPARSSVCPPCASKASRAASNTGTASSTMPAWRWRWHARPPPRARCWSTTVPRLNCCTKAARSPAWSAKTRNRAGASRCAPNAWSTPPAPGWTCSASRMPRPRADPSSPWSRPARACTWWWTATSCPAITPCSCPRRPMAACSLPCPGWARSSWAPPTRRATTWRAPAVPRGAGLHPHRGRTLPHAPAHAGRRAQHVGRPAPAGQAPGR